MQLQRYMRNINSSMLFLFLITQIVQASETFSIKYDSGNTVTISKGADYDSLVTINPNSSYCGTLNRVTLLITTHPSNVASSNWADGKEVFSTSGNSSQNCLSAVGALLPYTTTFIGEIKSVCYSGGTLLNHTAGTTTCLRNGEFGSSVEDATCTISSGDITHDYGTILADEVEGKTMTTNATVSCTGGSSYGAVDVALSLSEEKVGLKDDDSLYAQLDLDGKGQSTTATIGINSSTNLSVTSTLHTDGNVSSGAFSGSSVLTMTYY